MEIRSGIFILLECKLCNTNEIKSNIWTCSMSNKLPRSRPFDIDISSKAFIDVGCSSFSFTWCSCSRNAHFLYTTISHKCHRWLIKENIFVGFDESNNKIFRTSQWRSSSTHFWVFENGIHIIQICIIFLLKHRGLVAFLEPVILQYLWNSYTLPLFHKKQGQL